jgi:nucleotide-binding universal stress UspA family protein
MEKFKLKKILVPVDFSETCGHACQQALLIAKAAKAEICLFTVITREDTFEADIPEGEGKLFYDKIEKSIADKLDKLIKENPAIQISKEIKTGTIYKEICNKSACENFDLIVMGTHGTAGFNEFFAGSNAYRVVSHAACPVITIQDSSQVKAFKNIILPIRLERSSRQKVDYIYELARLFNSTVHITGYTKSNDESRQQKVDQYVNQVYNYLTRLEISCTCISLFENNFTQAMLKYAKQNNADLIAVMAEHKLSLDQILKGDYTQQFVNHSPYPVLSVPVSYPDSELLTFTPYLTAGSPY